MNDGRPAETRRLHSTEENISIRLEEVRPYTLTDILQKVVRKTLEKNRSLIDNNSDIRGITVTVKLSDQQIPYKVFLTPQYESDPKDLR